MIVNVWRVIIKKVDLALPSSDQPVFEGEVQFCKSWSMEAKWVSTFRKIAPRNEKHSTKLDVYRDALLSHQSDDFGGKSPLSVIWSDDVVPTSFFHLASIQDSKSLARLIFNEKIVVCFFSELEERLRKLNCGHRFESGSDFYLGLKNRDRDWSEPKRPNERWMKMDSRTPNRAPPR